MSFAFPHYTCFDGHRRLASGQLDAVALALKHAVENGATGPVLLFDDATGRSFDIDMRGSDRAMLARLATHAANVDARAGVAPIGAARPDGSDGSDGLRDSDGSHDAPDASADSGEAGERAETPRGRGRPKLGVVAREVTLLPRHWAWLTAQPGGASVMLRKLVDEARRARAEQDERRSAQERAYYFMSAMAGDMTGFEEAARALFANDSPRFRTLIAAWPADVRDHILALAF